MSEINVDKVIARNSELEANNRILLKKLEKLEKENKFLFKRVRDIQNDYFELLDKTDEVLIENIDFQVELDMLHKYYGGKNE